MSIFTTATGPIDLTLMTREELDLIGISGGQNSYSLYDRANGFLNKKTGFIDDGEIGSMEAKNSIKRFKKGLDFLYLVSDFSTIFPVYQFYRIT
tara:strand:- start:687 stop:968 length:282 start_codon:yes stop_codon:yes gene_type:complete